MYEYCFPDLAKAFDKVQHKRFMEKSSQNMVLEVNCIN